MIDQPEVSPTLHKHYQETLAWLYSTQSFGIKLGLEQIERLLTEFLAHPRDQTRIIHIAGTNGKGSTAAMAEAILRASGVRTGLFTSPHLVDYRERIRVNGRPIPKDETTRLLASLRELCADWEHHPTFFELSLALAMKHFRNRACEALIIETGMGGRLDATNILPADVTAITPIGMDHQQWLGDTLAQIAAEKAGIFKRGQHAFSGPQKPEAQRILEQHAGKARVRSFTTIQEPLLGYPINLPGPHQQHNAALALAAVHALGFPLNADTVREGLAHVSWPGRYSRYTPPPPPIQAPSLILDTAHNTHAITQLITTLKTQKIHRVTLGFGTLKDKDYTTSLQLLAPYLDHLHLLPVPGTTRQAHPEEVSRQITPQLPKDLRTTAHPNLTQALREISTPHPLLITGSCHLIGAIYQELQLTPFEPFGEEA